MIAETALRLAGPGALLVSRPTGVVHVYTGPLTPSGRFIPLACRTVCRARTRRLSVIPSQRSSLHAEPTRRLCARCSARLEASPVAARRAGPLTTRDQVLAAHTTTTAVQLVHEAELAETPEQLDHVAHVSLALFGHLGCTTTEVPRGGRRTLHEHVTFHRRRLDPRPEEQRDATLRALQESATARRKADRQETWRNREERIARLGITNATR